MKLANDNSEPPDKIERRPARNEAPHIAKPTSKAADDTKASNQQQAPLRPIGDLVREWFGER